MMVSLAALFGLVFGSFLNVCIYRLPRDFSVVAPRSFCPECGASIKAFDNLPIVSYLVLRGRCRNCRQRVSWRYPAVELLTALAFALITHRYGSEPAALKWLIFSCLMIVLFFTDLEERLLPDECTLGGLFLGVVFAFFIPVPSSLGNLLLPDLGTWARSLAILAGSAVFLTVPIWAIAALYSRIRGREALGFGDVKLLACLAAFLGFENGIAAMLIASLAGSLLGLFLLLRHRSAALSFELPFGSFLCASALLLPLVRTIV